MWSALALPAKPALWNNGRVRTWRVAMGRLDAKAVLIYLGIGFVAGWLASLLLGGGGLIRNIIMYTVVSAAETS